MRFNLNQRSTVEYSDTLLERLSKFNKPEPRDLQKIFGPALATIANVAGADPARVTEIIDSWDVASVTAETVKAAVTALTAPTMDAMALARVHQAELEAELRADSAAHPLTARDRVLLERLQTPLAQRSRQSIEDELYEANTGNTREGAALPRITARHWAAQESHFTALAQELERRDCAVAGVPYTDLPAKREAAAPVGYAMSAGF